MRFPQLRGIEPRFAGSSQYEFAQNRPKLAYAGRPLRPKIDSNRFQILPPPVLKSVLETLFELPLSQELHHAGAQRGGHHLQ
jgi:hypothetical protein